MMQHNSTQLHTADSQILVPQNKTTTHKIDPQKHAQLTIIANTNTDLDLYLTHSSSIPINTHYHLHVQKNANVTWYLDLNGPGTITLELHLDEPGAHITLRCACILKDTHAITITTHQNHHAPHTTSDIMIKSILDNHASLQHKGTIVIAQIANHTQASQMNKNILLSKDTRTHCTPIMNVLNKNVRCTHGTATSHLNPDQLNYLYSRGLESEVAQQLLVDGFLDEVRRA